MSPALSFLLSFAVTLAILTGAVWMGFLARRAIHLTLVALSLASLGVTIFFAERLGKLYDLQSAGLITPVHLFLAKSATFSFLLPIASGLRTLRNPSFRSWHRKLAFIALALTVLAAATGTLMILVAEPLAAAAVSPG